MKTTNPITGTAMRSGFVAPTFDLVTGGVRPKAGDAATSPGTVPWTPLLT